MSAYSFPPVSLFHRLSRNLATCSVVFIPPKVEICSAALATDIALLVLILAGDVGDLLPIKGGSVAVSTKHEDVPGDRGGRRDAEDA